MRLRRLTAALESLRVRANTAQRALPPADLDDLRARVEALEEVAQSIDNYVNIVNDTSNKQYEDFNENIKHQMKKKRY